MGLAALSRWANPPGILTNEVTGDTKPQGANRYGFADWTGLVEYAALDFTSGAPVSEDQAMGLPGVGRGVRLMCSVVAQLMPYPTRNVLSVTRPTEVLDPTAILTDPDPSWHGRPTWTAAIVKDLMLHGNGFADKRNTDWLGFPRTLPLIHAPRVTWELSRDPGLGNVYAVGGGGARVELEAGDMFHAVINATPGKRMGRGLLAMYAQELRIMLAVEKAQWVVMSKGRPVGVLSVDADMVEDELKAAKAAFLAGVQSDGIAALVKAKFDPVSWNATDLALVDAREFNLRLASDITGVSAYLLGVPSESRVYANIDQEWTNFLRTSVQQYLDALQDPYSRCFPRGTEVRYDTDPLVRPDEKTRWEIYQIATGMGAMSVAEVRQEERMGPIGAPAVKGGGSE